VANIDLFRKEKTLAKLKPKIALLTTELEAFKKLAHVGEVRQRGFMVGIELVMNRATKQPYPPEDKIGAGVTLECRKQGLIIRPLGNVIILMPPLSVSVPDLRRMLQIAYAAIRRMTEGV
jgi:adenosylmethionine-8-amino-7-oxononanoate aminotransferase